MGPKRRGASPATRGLSPSGGRSPPGTQAAAGGSYSPAPPPGSVAAVPFAPGRSFAGDAPFGTSMPFAPNQHPPRRESFGSVPFGSMAFSPQNAHNPSDPYGSTMGSMAFAPGQSTSMGSVPYGSMAFGPSQNMHGSDPFGSAVGSMAFAPGQSAATGPAHASVPFMPMAFAPKQSLPLSDSYGQSYNYSDLHLSRVRPQTPSSPPHAMQSVPGPASAHSAATRRAPSPGAGQPRQASGAGSDAPRLSLSPRAAGGASGPAGVAPQSFQMMSSPPGASPSAPLPNGFSPDTFRLMSAPPAQQTSMANPRAPESYMVLSSPPPMNSSPAMVRGPSPSGASSARGPQALPLAVSPTRQGVPNAGASSPSYGWPSDPGRPPPQPPSRSQSPVGGGMAAGPPGTAAARSTSPAMGGRPSLPPRGQVRSRSAGATQGRAPLPPLASGGASASGLLLPPAISLTLPSDVNRHMALPMMNSGGAAIGPYPGQLPLQYSAPLPPSHPSMPMQPVPLMYSLPMQPVPGGGYGGPPDSVVPMSLPMQPGPASALYMSAVLGSSKPRTRRSKRAGATSAGSSRRSLSAPAETRYSGGPPAFSHATPPSDGVPPGLGAPPPLNVYPSYAVVASVFGPPAAAEPPPAARSPAAARSPSPLLNPSSDGVAPAPPQLALGSLVLPEAHASPRKICISRERIVVVDRTGLSGHVADRPSVCVFCGNLKRSTTTPFCDACALQRSGHVVRSHVFAAGTGAHASVEFPQSSHVEGEPSATSSRSPPHSSLPHALSDAFESNIADLAPDDVSPEALQAARDHVTGTNPWSLIDLLFTRLEQRWDAWKLEYITFADIMSREKEHALIRAPNDAIRTCDVCRINKGEWCCPPIALPIECEKQRWACHQCHEQGFKCHRGFLGGDKRYYNMFLLQKFFKEADKDGSGFLDFLEWLYLGIHIARNVFVKYDPARAPYLKLIRETYLHYSTEETMTYEQLMTLVEEQLEPLPYNIEWKLLWDKYSQGQDELEYHQFLWLMYHAARPDSPHVNRLERKPSRALPRVNTMRHKPERDAKPIANFDPAKNKKIKLLGQGGMSAAWLMDYDGEQVVGKIPLPSMDRKGILEMLDGARKQQKLRHRNILAVLGVADHVKPPIILLEVAAGGDLTDWYGKKVDPVLQWKVCKEVAEALSYLHTSNPPMMHRDLKGANVFLTKGQTAKLADFDMLVDLGPPRYSVSGICGTPGFMAPEVIAGGRYDTRVDIYSFASLLYEVTHGTFPFSKELENEPMEGPQGWFDATSRLTKAGVRPALDPKLVSSGVAQLITECWAASPDARPSMALVVQRLNTLSPNLDAETL